jgi:hypothetical protein
VYLLHFAQIFVSDPQRYVNVILVCGYAAPLHSLLRPRSHYHNQMDKRHATLCGKLQMKILDSLDENDSGYVSKP